MSRRLSTLLRGIALAAFFSLLAPAFAEPPVDIARIESGMIPVAGGTFQMGDTLGDCITGIGPPASCRFTR